MKLLLFVCPDVSPSGEKGYTATCPKLEIASQGDTEDEALDNLREAITLFLGDADPDELKRRYQNSAREPRESTYEIQPAAPRTLKKCGNCRHFHQSGMASEAGVSYCFHWTRKNKAWVTVVSREICPQFMWRLPPLLNTVWMFYDLRRLDALGYSGFRGPAATIEVEPFEPVD